MSLKLLEMQVALPRTIDASKEVEQLQQRGQLIGEHAKDELEKKLEQKKRTVIETNQKDSVKIKEEEKGKRDSEPSFLKNGQNNTEKSHTENHPYKGKTIDYSG